MEEKIKCPVCGSKNTHWKPSGALCCTDCKLIYSSITRKTINDPEAITEAFALAARYRVVTKTELDDGSVCYMKTEKKHAPTLILKDSGARREFETGAVRDISEGKGRCDLLPLDVVGKILKYEELECIETFKETKDVKALYTAIIFFVNNHYDGMETAFLELGKHFEAGALKYGENNWKKGIPLHCYLDSAVRHYLKHLRGDTDEPHDRAFVWNLLCAIWTYTHKPELDDVEVDLGENHIEQTNR